MTSTPLPLARVAPRFVLFAALLFAAGCASNDGRPSREARKRGEHFPTMAGQETFFKGGITAEVLVGAMTGFDLHGGPGGGDGGKGGGRRHGGGGMRMGMTGGMRSGFEGGPGVGVGNEDDVPGRQQALATRRADNMGSPPVLIHLRFVNNRSEEHTSELQSQR